jgi:uncharacterized membrane protein
LGVTLSETGVARVRGYLFVLDRALQSRLPRQVARDAVKEIETHIYARVSETDAGDDERGALERILAELGTPLRVARAYSVEQTLDEAVLTGRVLPILRAIANAAFATMFGFIAAIFLFTGYVAGIAFLIIGIAKPLFPDNVGIWRVNGPGSIPSSLGFQWNTSETPAGGNWVILIGFGLGLIILAFTHFGARAFLAWYRQRRRPGVEPLA